MLTLAFLAVMKFAQPAPDVKFQQPQVSSTGDRLGITFGAGNDIFFAQSSSDGESFSRLSRIETGGKLALGRHRGPRLVLLSKSAVITAIVGAKGGGTDGDLLAWRTEDDGRTWSKPVRINDVPDSAREGLHAMAAGNGWIVAAWLDLRAKGMQLYFSKSEDGGLTWSKNRLVYESPSGTICQCCHPSIAVSPTGAIHIMWRNVLDGARDMFYSRSTDGGLTFAPARKLGRGTWLLNACPMDGGDLAISSGDEVFTVWRREKTIFVSKSDGKESDLGPGKDAAIAAGLNGSVYAVWSSPEGIQVRSTKVDQTRTLAPRGEYPRAIFTGRSVLAFWEQDGGIAMETLEEPAPLVTKDPR